MSPPSRRRGLKFSYRKKAISAILSPPSRRRGLKYHRLQCFRYVQGSPPSRRRGLKFITMYLCLVLHIVASFAEAWIEMSQGIFFVHATTSPPSRRRGLKYGRSCAFIKRGIWSPPSRRRGLKFLYIRSINFYICRLLRGGVD